ncbi:unnamed protein product [Clonostachys chloroleuca]|uniref:Alcohol acetyltransferase n=1 Tax=Clonostachys chloroleuca TaxID=1926264 RepID=A0AA35VUL1_9HYPO|nr:unnamed protein product [Clonostachys chloroleuca]
MAGIQQLEKLRPLGKLEQVSAACHHLGFFNNVGLSAHYKLSSSSDAADLRQLVFASAGEVVRKHPILSAIPVNEDASDAYFSPLSAIDLNQVVSFLERSQPIGDAEGEDKELDSILEVQHNTSFKTGNVKLPFWRLIILEDPKVKSEFTACFIYHHAIGDGVSGFVFHNAFHAALEAASLASPNLKAEETILLDRNIALLPPLEELHPLPSNPTPPAPPGAIPKEWTGKPVQIPCQSRWASLFITPKASTAFFQECKDKSVSVTSSIPSIIAEALFKALPSTEEAFTCIIPVSLRPWLNMPSDTSIAAIGTYFDAMKVQFTRADPPPQSDRTWARAGKVSKAINEYLANVSPSGEPYTAVSVFKNLPELCPIFTSMIGNPRDAAFEVTNIGRFTSGVGTDTERNARWEVGKMMLSRGAVVSGAAVTVSVATGGNGSMCIGFSWQNGIVEDGVIHDLVQEVKNYFEKYQ